MNAEHAIRHREVCCFSVPGRAVPWKAATVARRRRKVVAFKDASLKSWQEYVNLLARMAMAGRPPSTARIGLELVIVMEDRGSSFDITNALKAFEDALNGVCFEDDQQVDFQVTRRVWGSPEGVRVRVFELGG